MLQKSSRSTIGIKVTRIAPRQRSLFLAESNVTGRGDHRAVSPFAA